jgi:molybdopterin biosynthesis enzyme MoaB
VKAAVVTVSDGVSAGEREDESGALLVELLEAEHYEVEHRLVPDVRFQIAAVLDRVVPGIAEALRADAIRKTPHGLLGRGTAGIRGQALIVNLPGSPGGCRDGFALIKPALPHAIELIAGGRSEHRQT